MQPLHHAKAASDGSTSSSFNTLPNFLHYPFSPNKAGPDLNRQRVTTGHSHSYSSALVAQLQTLSWNKEEIPVCTPLESIPFQLLRCSCVSLGLLHILKLFFFFFFASSRNSSAIDTERGGRKGIELGLHLKFLVCVLRQLEASKLLLSIS